MLFVSILRRASAVKRQLVLTFPSAINCSTCEHATIKSGKIMDNAYSQDEKKLILNVINSASIKDLTTLKLTRHSAASLIGHRQQKGSYENVQELLQVDGLTATSLKRFCDVIIQGPVKKVSLKQVCTPLISDEVQKSIGNIVAMKVTAQHLIWAQINTQLEVIHWQRESVLEDVKWYPPSTIFEIVHNIVKRLPKSDVYVMEQMPAQLKQPASLVALTTTAAIHATLTSLLNYDYSVSQRHRVFTMKPNTLNTHFNIGVGNERVSCLEVLSQILSHNRVTLSSLEFCSISNAKDIKWPYKLEIPEHLITNYLKEKSSGKDEMGTALLLALVFYDLVVLGSSKF